MKLYDGGRAPNPRRVAVFLAEKNIDLPKIPVDMGALEHKSDAIIQRNPMARLPILELDDGTCISESVAICRYFEELQPDPPRVGRWLKCGTVVLNSIISCRWVLRFAISIPP